MLRLSHSMREEQMPAQRVSMRQVKAVVRLQWACGLSDRKMAQSLRLSRPPVAEYVRRAHTAGQVWPLPDSLDAVTLERRRFATTPHPPPARRPLPDWATVHQERTRQGVPVFL
jgi:hypothetical protein